MLRWGEWAEQARNLKLTALTAILKFGIRGRQINAESQPNGWATYCMYVCMFHIDSVSTVDEPLDGAHLTATVGLLRD